MKTTASDIQKKTIYKERKDCDKEEKNDIITETDTRSRIRSSPRIIKRTGLLSTH